MSAAEKLTKIAENMPKVYEAGKTAQYDEFWDNFQNYGKRTDYRYAFYLWRDEYIRPKYKITPANRTDDELVDSLLNEAGDYRQIFYGCPNLKKIEKKYFDFSQYETTVTAEAKGNYYTFANCKNLEEIEDIGLPPTRFYCTFRWCSKLHTIELLRSNENTVWDGGSTGSFHNCASLKNVRFEGIINSPISFPLCGKLTKESILSVISALADEPTTSKAEILFAKSAVDNAFKASDGTVGSQTDEWVAVVAEKSNWTFILQ